MKTTTNRRKTAHAVAVQFFARNAGYSYDPKTETPRQGKMRGARQLAHAEAYAANQGWSYFWGNDDCIGGDCEPCASGTPHECLYCQLCDSDGNVLASLGSICEPSSEYRRVVRAELALEAMPRS